VQQAASLQFGSGSTHAAVSAPPGRSPSSALRGFDEAASDAHLPPKPLCANLAGFSLHAAQSVPAHDRQALERLLRYILRPPFAQNRLSLSPDGQVVYQLRRPWVGGAQELILDPLDFLRRLTALLPRPYAHATRYHGCFAGRSAARPLLPKPPLGEEPAALQLSGEGAGGNPDGTAGRVRRYRLPWHRLLMRVFHADGLACPRCSRPGASVPMLVLAFLTDPPVIEKILRHLKLPALPPSLAPARGSTRVFPHDSSPALWQEPIAFDLPQADAAAEQERRGTTEAAQQGPPHIRPPP